MDNAGINVPIYTKLAQILFIIIGGFFILYIGQNILVPIIFATILAILLNPVVKYLTRRKINRVQGILLVLSRAIILLAGFSYFIDSQASLFTETSPQNSTQKKKYR